MGECGTCTALVDGAPVFSCLLLAGALEGIEITTIEGLARGDDLHAVQRAFADRGAVQCGFCTPSMILSAVGLLSHTPRPTRDEIRRGLSGNLCRCTGYVHILDAVEAAAASNSVFSETRRAD